MKHEEAKVVANKVNELIQSSYINQTTFTVDDVKATGLTAKQADSVLKEFQKTKIVYYKNGLFYAHPMTLLKIQKGGDVSV